MKLTFTLELSDELVSVLSDNLGFTTQQEIAEWFADTYYESSVGYLSESVELDDLPVLKPLP